MENTSKIDIENAAAEAIKEAVPWHTVGIITRDKGIAESGIGTGAAIEWHAHFIILTAKHVIQDTPHDELRFFLRPSEPLETSTVTDVNAATLGLESRRRLPIRSVVLSDDDDIALIELDATSTSIDNLRFHVLDRNTATPPPGETVTVAGYPSDSSHVVAAGARAASLTMQATFIEQPRDLRDHDPSSCFLMKHEFAVDGVHARGLSGAGVWWRRRIASGLWHANLELAGIVTNYYPDSQLLEALKIERVVSFLHGIYP